MPLHHQDGSRAAPRLMPAAPRPAAAARLVRPPRRDAALARRRPARRADPYSVWLSEIMLQQTTVATVGPVLPAFRRALADDRGVGGSAARRRAARLAGPRLLRARAQSARCARGRHANDHGGTLPGQRRRRCWRCRASAPTPRRPSPPSPSGAGGRASTAMWSASWRGCSGSRAPLPDSKPLLYATGRQPDAGLPSRRPCAGDDGPRCHNLRAAEAEMHAVPVAVDACAGMDVAESLPRKRPKTAEADAPGRRLLAGARRWRRAVAPPPGERAAGRHGRGAVERLGRGAASGRVDARAGPVAGRDRGAVGAAGQVATPSPIFISSSSCAHRAGERCRPAGLRVVPARRFRRPRTADRDEEGRQARADACLTRSGPAGV